MEYNEDEQITDEELRRLNKSAPGIIDYARRQFVSTPEVNHGNRFI